MRRIARAAYWLLNYNNDLIKLKDVKMLYKEVLRQKGISINKRFQNLPSGLENYCFANDISTDPVMQLRYDSFIWIKCLVDRDSFDSHPLDHLIFMDYLGIATEQLILNKN